MKPLKAFIKKITYFDRIVISIFVILLSIVFFFFYRKGEYVDIRVKVTDKDILYSLNNPQNWYADRFVKGDVEKDILGNVMTEIKNVQIYSIDNFTKAVYLDLKVRATYDSRSQLYSARGKKLVFGIPVRFSLSGVSFDGVITEPPFSKFHENDKVTTANIDVIVRSDQEDIDGRELIEPKVIMSLKVGDTIEDSEGNVMAKIVKIVIKPSEKVVQDDHANLFLRQDPLYKDALITLTVDVKNHNGNSYIFNDFPLRMGGKLGMAFRKTYVQGKIVGIDEKD